MLQIPLLHFVILFSQISSLPAVPNLDPEPALIPPSLVLSISSPNSATVPAFPEQSTAAVPCPLDLPPALLHSVSAACSAPETPSLPSRPRCCPALAAWLFSAHSAAGLAIRSPPLSSASTADLPILPDDSESCAAAAEAALRAQGVVLPRPNDTCDVAYCYCGIRLGPLRCPGSFAASASEGRWVVAREDNARSLERECAHPGVGGCARCLQALYQLRSEEKEGGGHVPGPGRREGEERDRECQLMGLTWLLAKDRTRYLRTAAFVLRAFMMSPDVDPTTCSLPGSGGGDDDDDDVPLSVDFGLDGDGASSAVRSPLPPFSFRLGLFSLLLSLF